MNYYIKQDGTITKDSTKGYEEYNSPIHPDGVTILPKHKNLDMEAPEVVAIVEAKALTKLIADGEALVTKYIQDRVDALNTELGTKYADIHAVESYSRVLTYPHATRCSELWLWSVNVWVKAREEQANAIATNMTPEEFTLLLDAVE